MRRTLLLASLAFLTVSCGGSDDAASGAEGGTIIIGAGADADALLPPLYMSIQGRTVGELMFDRLADIGPELKVIGDDGFLPRLARSWSWSADSLAITFAIDPAARWHDGVPVRAGDVAFAFRLIKDPANASPVVANLGNVDSVVVVDSLTAAVHFARRGAEQFYHATLITPLPEHRLGAIGNGQALRTHEEALKPVGSGRFRFVSWVPKERFELAAVEDHYRGRPKLDRVLFVISAPAAGYARVWAGETDFWEPLPPNIVADAVPHPHVRLITGPGYEYGFLAFNLRSAVDSTRPHPLFGDRELRRALTMAVDRDAVRQATFDSLALPGFGPFVRAQQTADTTITQIPFDSAAASQALDALGWRSRGADGIRRRGAQRLAFAVHAPTSSPTRIQAATVIQEQLRQMGVEMTLRAIDFQTMLAERAAGKFDAIMWTWRSTPSPGGIRGTWGSAAITGGSGQNISSYANAEFDRAVVDGLAAPDLASRRANLRRAFQIIVDDAPAMWLYEARNIAVAHRRLVIPTWRSDAWWLTLGEWSIDPAQRLPRDARPAAATP